MNSKLENKLLVVIRVRGRVGVRQSITETLKRLNLSRVNNLAVIYGNKSNLGMIQKCNDFVTYGEITDSMFNKLLEAKQIKLQKDELESVRAGKVNLRNVINKTITMHPPRHGYEGTKFGYSSGGALGYRGEAINDLIKRML